MITNKSVISCLITTAALFYGSGAHACSCEAIPKTPSAAFKAYNYIFSGKIVDRKLGAGGVVIIDQDDAGGTASHSPKEFDVLFEIKHVFKGNMPSFVVVRTTQTCEDPFTSGDYLVFVDDVEGLYLQYDACANSFSKTDDSATFNRYFKWLKANTQPILE